MFKGFDERSVMGRMMIFWKFPAGDYQPKQRASLKGTIPALTVPSSKEVGCILGYHSQDSVGVRHQVIVANGGAVSRVNQVDGWRQSG